MNQPKIELRHGDCLTTMQSMKAGSVDLVVSSPPYNMLNSTGGGLKARIGSGRWKNAALKNGYTSHNDNMPWDEYREWQHACVRQMWRLLSDDGAIFYNHKPRIQQGQCLFPQTYIPDELQKYIRQCVIWNRGQGFNFNTSFFLPSHEYILIIARPDFRLTGRTGTKDVWAIPHERHNTHPAPFPVELARRAIAETNARTVLDPFCGSGTTAIAAALEGRNSIGIDNDLGYLRDAEARIAKAVPLATIFSPTEMKEAA